MADINKRFKIGNTTVNLGKVDLGGLQHIQCVNQITVHPVVTDLCEYHTRIIGCVGVTLPRTVDITDPDILRITPPQLTPQLRSEEVVVYKAALMEELKVLEAHEMALKELETPQSMKEIEAVEDNLVNSLAEVQKLKEEFSKNN